MAFLGGFLTSLPHKSNSSRFNAPPRPRELTQLSKTTLLPDSVLKCIASHIIDEAFDVYIDIACLLSTPRKIFDPLRSQKATAEDRVFSVYRSRFYGEPPTSKLALVNKAFASSIRESLIEQFTGILWIKKNDLRINTDRPSGLTHIYESQDQWWNLWTPLNISWLHDHIRYVNFECLEPAMPHATYHFELDCHFNHWQGIFRNAKTINIDICHSSAHLYPMMQAAKSQETTAGVAQVMLKKIIYALAIDDIGKLTNIDVTLRTGVISAFGAAGLNLVMKVVNAKRFKSASGENAVMAASSHIWGLPDGSFTESRNKLLIWMVQDMTKKTYTKL